MASSNTSFIRAWVSLTRLPNLLLIALFFVLADVYLLSVVRDHIGASPALSDATYGLFILNVLIAALSGYWMNDYFDYEVDLINRPDRALPSGLIPPKRLKKWSIGLAVVGFGITTYLGFIADRLQWVWLYPVTILALHLYARYGKRWGIYGNLIVSLFIAVLPLLLVLIEWDALITLAQRFPSKAKQILTILAGYFALMFLSNLAREIAKDAEDHKGDMIVGSTSIAHRSGLKGTQWSLYLLYVSVASVQWGLFSALPFSLGLLSACYLITGILVLLAIMTSNTQIFKGFSRVSTLLKVLMLAGVLELLTLPHII